MSPASTAPGQRPGHFRRFVSILSVPVISMVGVAGATASSRVASLPKNQCTAIGANKAVAVKFFGKGAYPVNVTQYDPPACDIDGPHAGQLISPSGRTTAGQVWVVLTRKLPTTPTLAAYAKYNIPNYSKGSPVSGLGAGAILLRVGNDPYVYFAAGLYFIEEFDAAGVYTDPISTYIPSSELLNFARYIDKRLS